ncbi:UDP-3-O-(3-hydroxymyristoyl)glucosamine N-acyltransferase [Beijerinckiaceae bacterium RH AL1]|nr:UDP-3-O-(3-hydroxymyristoyl)glucosamine N-acyltransferase [Beijerinckiaceae bacterium RH AL1]
MSDFKIHPTSVLGPHVTVEPGAIIGANCTIEGRTRIGARTTLAGGVALVGDVDVGADCIIEANVSVTTAAASDGPQARPLVIGAKARIGAGAVLSAGVRIGADATVEAGTVVLRDVPAHAVVRGNPGIVVGFQGPAVRAADLIETVADPKVTGVAECGVAGVKIYRFPRVTDPRGSLTFGEFGRNIPFVPKRYFMVFDVPRASCGAATRMRLARSFSCASAAAWQSSSTTARFARRSSWTVRTLVSTFRRASGASSTSIRRMPSWWC